ncbi:MAG: NTP transferase domain-containing protein [Nannocystaceae bacterium]|nr:NTP transferase domain-containing protein [Nannocystaceae bacterium]
MQVVTLAAGLGARLGDMTKATPKALIEVADRPLLDYALRFAAKVGATRRLVVGGFCHEDVATFVRGIAPEATIIENPDYRLGNLLTLVAALPHLQDGGFLLMNTDHIYRPTIADVVRKTIDGATSVTAICDFDRKLTSDDMKVGLDGDRRVETMSKQLETWDCGYVGMTYVPAAKRAVYQAAVASTREVVGEKAVVEQVLVQLATSGEPVEIADISGHGWLEIDEPHERAHAEATLEAEHWWE